MTVTKVVSIKERVHKVIEKNMGKNITTILDDTRLKEDLGKDSLDSVEMVMALEDEFDIEISDEDLEKIGTVADIIKYIEDKKKS